MMLSLTRICLSVVIMVSLSTSAWGNLLENADFSEISPVKLPLQWEFRGASKKAFSSCDGVMTLKTPAGTACMLIQHGLSYKKNRHYEISYEAKGKGGQFRIYTEWVKLVDGKEKYFGKGVNFKPVPKEWQLFTERFQFGSDTQPPYLVIHVSGGELNLRNLKVVEVTQKELNSTLFNSDFRRVNADGTPAGWSLAGKHKRISCQKGEISYKAEGSCLLIQRGLKLKPESYYKVGFEILAKGEGSFRSYVEWAGGGAGLFNMDKASEKWKPVSFLFKFPSGMSNPYFVLHTKSPETTEIRIRNLTMRESKEEVGAKELGGRWLMSPFAKQSMSPENTPITEISQGHQNSTLKNVPVKPGKKYELTFSAQGIGTSGTVTGYFPFRLEAAYKKNQTIDTVYEDTWNASSQNKRFVFTAPVDRVNFVFAVGAGTIRFSDFKLQELTEVPAEFCSLTVTSPSYRNTIFASMPVSKLSGNLSVDKKVRSVHLTLSSSKQLIAEQTILPEVTGRFEFDVAELENGSYKLQADFLDEGGNKLARKTEIIRKLPPMPIEVVVGADKRLYRNGKAFLPIVFWELPAPTPETLYYMARRGVNTYFINVNNSATALKLLDEAEKFQFKIILSSFVLNPPKQIEGEPFDLWRHNIASLLSKKVRNHPALLGYFLADEPGWTGVPQRNLVAAYKYYRELDPYRPVWINAAPRGTVGDHRRFSEACDIYGLDIYPVPYPSSHSDLDDKGLTCVGKYTTQMEQAVAGRKPVWMALQGFNWNDLHCTIPAKYGYPTFTESRFMAYDALTNGAHSLSWWGVNFALNADFIEDLLKLTRELHSVSGLINKGQWEAVSGVSSVSAIRTHRVEVGADTYLVALNTSNKKQVATVSYGDGRVTVFGENRSVRARDGKFRDSFEPFAVHVYGMSPLPETHEPLIPVNDKYESIEKPFHAAIRKKLSVKYYQGKAKWIWARSLAQTPGSKVWLARPFKLKGQVKKATLRIATDDTGVVYINGTRFGNTGGCFFMKKYDCGSLLRNGENLINVAAEDLGGLPCGVLAELKIEYVNGTEETIVSNAEWRVSETMVDKWLDANASGSWPSAFVVANYGDGVWGKRVVVE